MTREFSGRGLGGGLRLDSSARRLVDIVISATALVVLLPCLLFLAAAVRLSSRGPVLYQQQRIGRGERPFFIWKFRTMVVGADRKGPAVSGPGDPRITGVGRWLRPTRLDELPQLVNVLRGDITLIGPRPEVQRFLPFYTATERRLFEVRPGVMGPGAILFATSQAAELDTASDPDAHYVAHHLHPKLALDLDYLFDRRLGSDLRLITRCLLVVMRPSRA